MYIYIKCCINWIKETIQILFLEIIFWVDLFCHVETPGSMSSKKPPSLHSTSLQQDLVVDLTNPKLFQTHRIYGIHIYIYLLHEWLVFIVNQPAKHTSPMDPMGKQNNSWVCLTKSNVVFFSSSSMSVSNIWGRKHLSTKSFNHPWIFQNVRQSNWIMSPVFWIENTMKPVWKPPLRKQIETTTYRWSISLCARPGNFTGVINVIKLYYQPKTMHYHKGNPPKLPIYMCIKINPPPTKKGSM